MPLDESSSKALTYSSYLKVDELLELQRPLSDGPEHDEMLFIVIHQVYELWFKQVLHEVSHLQRRFEAGDSIGALATLKRILTIFKTLVGQVDILETMTPISFNSFRSRLDSASGFQSAQFRELEFKLGKKSAAMVRHHPEGTPGRRRLDETLEAPTLWDSFLRFLAANDQPVPQAQLARDASLPYEPSPEVQRVLLDVYADRPILAMVCERMVDLDEGLQEWRYRHVKMVERTIGAKPGTGGSEGAAYLRKTLFQPAFPDLWAIRSEL
ncbi:MAG: tryptophan 2,3-dioxygenase family protein [Thermoanaerobaculia bacterium]